MYVNERFQLPAEVCEDLRSRPVNWGFGLFSEVIYYRTYSRARADGSQEQWADTVIRVVEGCMSIRKDWYKRHSLKWDDAVWMPLAVELAGAIFEMKMLPPGRGLWAMGTDYIFQRGSMALNNCGFVDVIDDLGDAAAWAMDALMCGVGVGFSTQNQRLVRPHRVNPANASTFVIPDTREGWVDATRMLIDSYMKDENTYWKFDYSKIRPKGTPLKGFGGIASGPDPLIQLHERLRNFLDHAAMEPTPWSRVIVDVFNSIGACVVAGNVRRSAELATGALADSDFLNLKDYAKNPSRAEIGWMSNNSVVLSHSSQFEMLPDIANRVRDNGEPGILNLLNIQKYARYGKKKSDLAVGMNPCAEIPLESKELCNLAEVFPTRCKSVEEVWRIMELATFYVSTVALLPSHDEGTNEVVARNRRIGVSVSGVADWIDATSWSHVTMALRDGYEKHVEPINIALARAAGVPPSVRLTTVKPSGTISLLAGVSPGMHWPYDRYCIRRVRISDTSPLVPLLSEAGYVHEVDRDSAATLVFEFPLASNGGKTRAAKEVSIWEQASLVTMLQREWADNSVSNTLYFRQAEANQVERVIAACAPMVKSISMLPDQEEKDGGGYYLPPYESITKTRYVELSKQAREIDWSDLSGTDGIDSRFCETDHCEI